MRSTKSLPTRLWVPKLLLRHSTTGRRARLNSAKGSLPPLVCRTVLAGFLAPGSSSRSASVISTSRARSISAASVYLVVTVTVDRRQIAIGVIPVLLVPVMYLQQRLWQEEESTVRAPALLPVQEGGYPSRDTWIGPPAPHPIVPVPIERACRRLHFAVPGDGHCGVLVKGQPLFCGKLPPRSLLNAPVAAGNPPPPFVGMAIARPAG